MEDDQPDINAVLIENAKQIELLATAMVQMLNDISWALNNQKQIVRGPDGKIIGVK